MESGWIKLNRKMLEWEWYDDINTKVLFLHLLLTANWEEKRWKGVDILPGQLVTSISKLASETGVSERSIRTSLKRLARTGEIDKQVTNKYTLITIVKYRVYQGDAEESDRQVTNKQQGKRQASDRQAVTQTTTTKEVKNKVIVKEKLLDNNNIYNNKNSLVYMSEIDEVVQYYNRKAGTKCRSSTKAYVDLITRVFKDGYTVDDCKKVIDKKAEEWLGDNHMAKFFRINTLFAPSHFDTYLNEPCMTGNRSYDELLKEFAGE